MARKVKSHGRGSGKVRSAQGWRCRPARKRRWRAAVSSVHARRSTGSSGLEGADCSRIARSGRPRKNNQKNYSSRWSPEDGGGVVEKKSAQLG